jgi:hypothetical protein
MLSGRLSVRQITAGKIFCEAGSSRQHRIMTECTVLGHSLAAPSSCCSVQGDQGPELVLPHVKHLLPPGAGPSAGSLGRPAGRGMPALRVTGLADGKCCVIQCLPMKPSSGPRQVLPELTPETVLQAATPEIPR